MCWKCAPPQPESAPTFLPTVSPRCRGNGGWGCSRHPTRSSPYQLWWTTSSHSQAGGTKPSGDTCTCKRDGCKEVTIGIKRYFWHFKIIKKEIYCTFQTTICHVCCCSRVPWAAMVENNVCPALLRTAGRGSTHNSPSLAYRHNHRQSKGGAGWKGRFRVSPFSWACFCRASSSLSNSCVIASPLWKK